MTAVLLDTLSGEHRPLEPIEPGHVRIYSCGPTVYGPAHVGNFRSFLFADVLVRHLRHQGLRVTWVMNITDVDDKIIRNARAEGVAIGELADRWLARFVADAAALRMTTPDVLPRATEHIPDMVALIQQLVTDGHAYRTDDGSIFFRISSWPSYGRLAKLDPEQLRVGERVEADEYGKDDVRDFALWKGPKDGEPSWDTAIGPGRPGWHIECSAMSMRHLGPSFDIHTGGVDLVFPHHEDEIAQSEAATGVPFVRTWLHCAHLRLDGTKMAKSTGNIARVIDLLDAGVSPQALRLALISVHYRQALDFSDASLEAAKAALERLDGGLAALGAYREERADDPAFRSQLSASRERFDTALDDDLNVSAGLAVIFDLIRETNRRIADRAMSTEDARRAAEVLQDLDSVLGLLPDAAVELPAGAAERLDARARARADRDWAAADRLRDELLELGVAVEDTRDGQRWKLAEHGAPRTEPVA
ncbi:MAG TPA: cysteine--tRNA ligase [Candidatus Limnocylindrales bacterium]